MEWYRSQNGRRHRKIVASPWRRKNPGDLGKGRTDVDWGGVLEYHKNKKTASSAPGSTHRTRLRAFLSLTNRNRKTTSSSHSSRFREGCDEAWGYSSKTNEGRLVGPVLFGSSVLLSLCACLLSVFCMTGDLRRRRG